MHFMIRSPGGDVSGFAFGLRRRLGGSGERVTAGNRFFQEVHPEVFIDFLDVMMQPV